MGADVYGMSKKASMSMRCVAAAMRLRLRQPCVGTAKRGAPLAPVVLSDVITIGRV